MYFAVIMNPKMSKLVYAKKEVMCREIIATGGLGEGSSASFG
jgi:hypothetical protein